MRRFLATIFLWTAAPAAVTACYKVTQAQNTKECMLDFSPGCEAESAKSPSLDFVCVKEGKITKHALKIAGSKNLSSKYGKSFAIHSGVICDRCAKKVVFKKKGHGNAKVKNASLVSAKVSRVSKQKVLGASSTTSHSSTKKIKKSTTSSTLSASEVADVARGRAHRRRTQLLKRIEANRKKSEPVVQSPKKANASSKSSPKKNANLLATKSTLTSGMTAQTQAEAAFVAQFTAQAKALGAATDDFLLNLDREEGAGFDGTSEDAQNKKSENPTTHVQETAEANESDHVYFGPNKCLSTYKKGNSCWIEGSGCSSAAMKDQPVGFTCVNSSGSAKQHLFGDNSWQSLVAAEPLMNKNADSHSQAFKLNTLVTHCSLCLGLDDDKVGGKFYIGQNQMQKEVKAVSREVKDLESIVSETIEPAANKIFAKKKAEKDALWGADYAQSANDLASEEDAYYVVE